MSSINDNFTMTILQYKGRILYFNVIALQLSTFKLDGTNTLFSLKGTVEFPKKKMKKEI